MPKKPNQPTKPTQAELWRNVPVVCVFRDGKPSAAGVEAVMESIEKFLVERVISHVSRSEVEAG